MKNRINLFKQKPQLDFISANAHKFKMYLNGAGIMLFVCFLLLIYQVLRLSSTQQALLKMKETYLKYLLEENDVEANIRYFISKQTQVNTFLKDDARFLPYYQILKKSLEETSNNVVLDTIDIDKSRKTRFIVKFKDTEEMLSFIRYIEGEEFLKNFISLSLQSFVINKQTKGSRYQLELQGIFKEIKTE